MRKHSKECDDYMKLDEWAAKEDTQVLFRGLGRGRTSRPQTKRKAKLSAQMDIIKKTMEIFNNLAESQRKRGKTWERITIHRANLTK